LEASEDQHKVGKYEECVNDKAYLTCFSRENIYTNLRVHFKLHFSFWYTHIRYKNQPVNDFWKNNRGLFRNEVRWM